MSGKETVNFEALEAEGAAAATELSPAQKYLKEKLKPEDFNAYTALAAAECDEEDEGEDKKLGGDYKKFVDDCLKKGGNIQECAEKWKAKQAAPAEGGNLKLATPEYKAFMESCVKAGKDEKACTDEWKTQYPGPSTGPSKESAELAELKATVKQLTTTVAQLTQQKDLAEVTGAVNGLVNAKHLAPAQRNAVIQLAATLPPEQRASFLKVFEAQKMTVGEDKGKLPSEMPGAQAMTPERKQEIKKMFHIDEMILDRGVKAKVGGNN